MFQIPLAVQVLHPLHCKIVLFLWPGFQYVENVHHAQFGQFCIWISYFKRVWHPVCGLLCSFEVVLIQHLLGDGQCESVCFKIQHSRIWVSQETLHGL